MSSDKREIRKKFKEKRKALSDKEINDQSQAIAVRFINWLETHPEIEIIHLYLPIDHQKEVNTFLIRDLLFEKGKSVFTSVIEPDSLQMKSVQIFSDTEYKVDNWGIPAPFKVETVKSNLIQLVLVPLLAYDIKGNRIGFGKGYYDIFLSGLESTVIKVGLSFFEPVSRIEAEEHDIPLDYCFTAEKVFTF